MSKRTEESGISELVGVFCDPIIVFPSGWEDTLPDWIKPAITLERLIECAKYSKGEMPTGTDAEAMAYMYPRTMSAPLDHDWTEIYLYLSTQVIRRHQKTEIPEDIAKESLTDDQTRQLNDLKAWIYQRRRNVRDERRRDEKRQAKEAADQHRRETVGEQMSLPLAVE